MNVNSVEQSVADLDAAFNRGDIDAVLGHYDDDAVLMVEPGRTITGKDNLRGFFELFARSGSTARQDRMHVTVQGDLALYLSRWTLLTPQADAAAKEQHFVATSIFRKGADDRWRLAIDNSFGPMVLDLPEAN
ncbi:MAG TPA: SgcJ/EcaC family oxidoreductase [Dokdonella sp.]|nr:SgcJ/EcaC family oxidoreductase [Dokdonella sp.]